jgi:CoA:oxalate CoA-transferase
MGREDMIGDAHFATHDARCARMDEVDAMVGEWTASLTRDQLMQISRTHRFPAAPVRQTAEVVRDPHLHARGMLTDFDHPELGPIVLPNSPLRFEGLPPMALRASPALGQDNDRILGRLSEPKAGNLPS